MLIQNLQDVFEFDFGFVARVLLLLFSLELFEIY